MAVERTLSIIKPDAVERNLTGKINAMLEAADFKIVAQKRVLLTRAQCEEFYAEHKERPFFGELCDFMSSSPVVLQVLEGDGAIQKHRDVIGATDPAEAAEGTVRKAYGLDKGKNSVHGSANAADAAREIALFFAGTEMIS